MKVSILLAGGIGSRLWPKSNEELPKQFHKFLTEDTLLYDTINRLDDDTHKIIISNTKYQDILDDKYLSILEPEGKNTAPAICISTLIIMNMFNNIDPKDILISVLPSDHYFDENFSTFLNKAYDMLDGNIITFGVKPTYPETGYGYIQHDKQKIIKFVEKPDLTDATRYIESGNFLWNAGVFLFSAKTIIDEFINYAPDIYNICKKTVEFVNINNDRIILDNMYTNCNDISFDYAIMEHTKKGCVLAYDHIWNDIGQWDRLHMIADKDKNNNIAKNCHTINCNNCYIESDFGNVFVIGMNDSVIVKNNSDILVSSINNVDQIKTLLPKLKNNISNRPWGYYQTIYKDINLGFHSKKIVVFPNKRLSLQYHHHRAEHWTICSGSGTAQVGDDIHEITKNSHIYVPTGVKHRIHNTGNTNLVFIETQIGKYLEEDDIVRLEDDFGRK